MDQPPRVRVLAAADRPVSAGSGVRSAHALAFGAHYDPQRTAWGALVAHNDDTLEPGAAYGPHDHRDVEVLAWVRAGRLRHRGPDGAETVVPAGTLQHLAAGTGWHHDEAADGDGPLRVLQVWIAPGLDDPPPGPPSLAHTALDLTGGRPVLVAAGERVAGTPLLALRRADAAVTAVRLVAGGSCAVGPAGAAWRHVHVADGSARLAGADRAAEGGPGDSFEVAGPGGITLTAGPGGAEVLVVATL